MARPERNTLEYFIKWVKYQHLYSWVLLISTFVKAKIIIGNVTTQKNTIFRSQYRGVAPFPFFRALLFDCFREQGMAAPFLFFRLKTMN